MVGITAYSTYIPKFRIKAAEIAKVWGKRTEDVESSLQVKEKAVAAVDEDSVTLAVTAAYDTYEKSDFSYDRNKGLDVDIVFVGSESHPYAVNPTSTIVGEMIGLKNNYLAADLEFACKAATAGIQSGVGLIETGKYKTALIIGADCAQSKTHDPLEYTAASAAAAFVLGRRKVLAEIKEIVSFSSDTPDFWRRDGIRYPSHGGRFTGKPAYFKHIKGAAELLLKKSAMKPEDFSYCVFHMPNGKFPRRVAKQLGFKEEQLKDSLLVEQIGNPYSASSLIGLAAVLDNARPHDTIFMVSYGSGAGADGFVFEVTDEIVRYRKKQKNTVKQQIENKEYINYVEYLKMTDKI